MSRLWFKLMSFATFLSLSFSFHNLPRDPERWRSCLHQPRNTSHVRVWQLILAPHVLLCKQQKKSKVSQVHLSRPLHTFEKQDGSTTTCHIVMTLVVDIHGPPTDESWSSSRACDLSSLTEFLLERQELSQSKGQTAKNLTTDIIVLPRINLNHL